MSVLNRHIFKVFSPILDWPRLGLAIALVASLLFSGNGVADEVKGQTLNSKGVPIYYTVEGSGPPVLLVHGLYSSGQMNWRAPGVTKALVKHYQVITVDLRGHGGSGKPEKESDYGVEMVEDLIRLLDHLKIQEAHVVGYSMGGMITMKMLTLRPERVSSAVLGGMGWLREGSPLQEFWGRIPDRKNPRGTPAACPRSLGALAVTEAQVKAIKVPVEIIVGDRDPVKRMYVEPLEGIRPDWPVKVVSDAGHINCIMQTEFREDIEKWLAAAAGQR
jgi:pimeloyl-ACP methyl ester carboxylesterase